MPPDDPSTESDEFDPHSLGPETPSVELPDLATDAERTADADAVGADTSAEHGDSPLSGTDANGAVESGELTAADVDPETGELFWKLVVTFDVALPAIALGLLFIYFQGRLRVGAALVATGVVFFTWGVLRAYQFTRSDGGGADGVSQ